MGLGQDHSLNQLQRRLTGDERILVPELIGELVKISWVNITACSGW